MTTPWKISLSEVEALLPPIGTAGTRSTFPIAHGTMRAGLYAPVGSDPQDPHPQDEIYIILSGTGMFVRGEERQAFQPGDILFVPALMEHRFEDFSDDFKTWVVFWGRRGGE